MKQFPPMRKLQVLGHLEVASEQDVNQIARACQMTLENAGMHLLRLFRQTLVHREFDPRDRVFFYSLSKKGQERLVYLRNRAGLMGATNAKACEYSKAERKFDSK